MTSLVLAALQWTSTLRNTTATAIAPAASTATATATATPTTTTTATTTATATATATTTATTATNTTTATLSLEQCTTSSCHTFPLRRAVGFIYVLTSNTSRLLVGKYVYLCYRCLQFRLAIPPGFHVNFTFTRIAKGNLVSHILRTSLASCLTSILPDRRRSSCTYINK